eukprot:TRINITY_DN124677_c0_g1_i1.p1 TRINITY_DN124677_c0_g1~~TRINITY_DN124677_c0_g1_i1.p1  ORF type:complete len:272 (-),score=38.58 TRINITY_DN124677_c0_g1_i1:471-1286(-)
MTFKMTPPRLLSAVLLAAMVLMDDVDAMPSFSDRRLPGLNELDARCQNNKSAIFPHPDFCHLYFNCSDGSTSLPWYFTPHLKECRYPQLFSTVTSRCQKFDDVTCGDRQELLTHCEYWTALCPGFMCRHCNEHFPSCTGLADGANPWRGDWSPFYVVCRSQRTVAHGRCPTHPILGVAQLLHLEKRLCVSLYEVPTKQSGVGFNCTHKTDGLHLDDTFTVKSDLYYRCFDGKLVDVHRCEQGLYFDQMSATCSAKPLYNRFVTPDEPGPAW